MSDHASDLFIDRLLAGEPVDADMAAHAQACERCRARVAALTAERDAFAVPRTVARTPSRRWLYAVPPLLAAAAAVVLVVVRRPDDSSGMRTKGTDKPILELRVQRDAKLELVTSGAIVHPEDRIQATYTAKVPGWGAVLSVDGAGTPTPYVQMTQLPAAPEGASYPESTVLDDVLGTERIAIVWCASVFSPETMLAALTSTRSIGDGTPVFPIAIPEGCAITLVEVHKQ